jgi:hypothetical protein
MYMKLEKMGRGKKEDYKRRTWVDREKGENKC